VEAFKNRAGHVFVWINDEGDCATIRLTIGKRWGVRWRRRSKYQAGKIMLDNELRAEGCHNRAHINMEPISTHGQALNPFRTVDDSVAPFIGRFRVQQGISRNAFLDLWLGEP